MGIPVVMAATLQLSADQPPPRQNVPRAVGQIFCVGRALERQKTPLVHLRVSGHAGRVLRRIWRDPWLAPVISAALTGKRASPTRAWRSVGFPVFRVPCVPGADHADLASIMESAAVSILVLIPRSVLPLIREAGVDPV